MTSNVVTYIVEITAPNPDGILIPYLTTNTKFFVKTFKDVLVIPNTALRWVPEPEYVVPGTTPPEGDRVWVTDENNHVYPVTVKIVENDGTFSVVEGDKLTPDMNLVTGTEELSDGASAEPKATGTTNPFAPKMPRRSSRR